MMDTFSDVNPKDILSLIAWVVPLILIAYGVSSSTTTLIQLGGFALVIRACLFYMYEMSDDGSI